VELLNVGGNANNGAQCGVSCANSNNAFSNSGTNIGARLKFCFRGAGGICLPACEKFPLEPDRHGMADGAEGAHG